jgi:NAD(P)-dependent dehydrogenase (short-subunit alcohol dehydrogenase family)
MDRDLAIVTGAAAGLGRAISRVLSAGGMHVVIADRDLAASQVLAHELSEAGGSATVIETDAAEEDQVTAMVREAGRLGRVRLLVNNAGGQLPGPQFPASSDWHRSLDLNLRMPMLAIQLCLPLLRDGGAVVNVSSSAGRESGAYSSPEYAAAKAGLIRFTTAVQDFAKRFGVRVSCVVPHWIGLDRAVRDYERMTPVERERSGGLIDPGVVADIVLHLAKDPDSAGKIIVIRAHMQPYEIDPAAGDPLGTWQEGSDSVALGCRS